MPRHSEDCTKLWCRHASRWTRGLVALSQGNGLISMRAVRPGKPFQMLQRICLDPSQVSYDRDSQLVCCPSEVACLVQLTESGWSPGGQCRWHSLEQHFPCRLRPLQASAYPDRSGYPILPCT